jgi:hypothetical protein
MIRQINLVVYDESFKKKNGAFGVNLKGKRVKLRDNPCNQETIAIITHLKPLIADDLHGLIKRI